MCNYFSVLSPVSLLNNTAIKQTSYKVTWDGASGNLDGYYVECKCMDQNLICPFNKSSLLPPATREYTCIHLLEGSMYATIVRTVRNGWTEDGVSSKNDSKTCNYFHLLYIF